MREYDETTPTEATAEGPPEAHEAAGDGVALSPYDSDLEAPTQDAEPEPYTLDSSAGYGEPADVVPAEPEPVPADDVTRIAAAPTCLLYTSDAADE